MGNPRITDWRERRVWILGASEGIGRELALQLAGRGARLALSARDGARLAVLAAECGNRAIAVPCDATEGASVDAALARIDREFGGIDIGIYMAGDYRPQSARAPGPEALPAAMRQLAVNYGGALGFALRLLSALAPGRPGRVRGIVLVASVAGYRGLPNALGYGPTKAALINLAECLHLELAAPDFGVWLVNPGFVATRLTAQNDFAMPALMQAPAAARCIVDGLAGGRFEIHFPKRFSLLLKALALLPYGLYFPLLRRMTRPAADDPAA